MGKQSIYNVPSKNGCYKGMQYKKLITPDICKRISLCVQYTTQATFEFTHSTKEGYWASRRKKEREDLVLQVKKTTVRRQTAAPTFIIEAHSFNGEYRVDWSLSSMLGRLVADVAE